MTDSRLVTISSARQGGYSVRQLPSAQLYAGEINMVIWYDSESARVFPSSAATITAGPSDGDYETTDHLGQLAYAPPPGILAESIFYRTWVVEMPDALTSGDFTIEAWMRSSTASPPSGGTGGGSVRLVWTDAQNDIFMTAKVGFTDIESPELTLEHEVFFSSQYEPDLSGGYQFDYQLFGATVQGWKHLCYQRIGNDDVFHYHGVRFNLTKGDESLPAPRPVTSDAQLVIYGENQATAGTAVGQVRASSGALYGTGNFTPPTEAFYIP